MVSITAAVPKKNSAYKEFNMPLWLDSLWHFVASTASIGTIIGCVAVAIAILLPPALTVFLPQLRLYAIVVAIVAFSFTTIAGKFYNDGLSVKQAQWDKAKAASVTTSEKARSDAERDVSHDTPEQLRNDPDNRDNDGR